MANLFVIREKATADVLIGIWCDFCNSEISKRKKELEEIEQEFKKNALDIVAQRIKANRKGCLSSLFSRSILAAFTGILVVGSRKDIAEQNQVEKLHSILYQNDLRNALIKIRSQQISILPELLPGIREFEKQDFVLRYWEHVQMVASLAKEQMINMPEVAERFASVFYLLLQKESSLDTKVLLEAFFNTIDSVLDNNISITISRLPRYIDKLIANGGYVDFSMKNYISEWMNTYSNTQKPIL